MDTIKRPSPTGRRLLLVLFIILAVLSVLTWLPYATDINNYPNRNETALASAALLALPPELANWEIGQYFVLLFCGVAFGILVGELKIQFSQASHPVIFGILIGGCVVFIVKFFNLPFSDSATGVGAFAAGIAAYLMDRNWFKPWP